MMLVALALAILQPAAASPAPPRFTDLPNVAVTYYDVTGSNIAEIHKSLTGAAPRDPATRKPLPATSSWSMAAAVKWSRTGAQCTITGVTLNFTARASLPHLVVQKETPAAVVTRWNAYVAALEGRQAAQLRFAYDRRGEVERAILASSCERWQAAADAALTRLEEQQRRARAADPSAQPKLEEKD